MLQDPNSGDRSVALAAGPIARATAGQAETSVALPRFAPLGGRLRFATPSLAQAPLAGKVALGTLIAGCLAVVVFASAQPTWLSPGSNLSFPGWLSGPLHGIFGRLVHDYVTIGIGFSVVLGAMSIAYGVALLSVKSLSMRAITVAVIAIHLVMLLSPPLQLTDVFNYLGYARLGALHHLNPYTHVIAQAHYDPVYRFSTWHHLHSPYGPAFTVVSYPLAFLPLAVAYWLLKVATIAASLGVIALVWRCARQLGRDPRFAVVFVAANPLLLLYALGGFHNDVFMLLPAIGAISLLIAGRERGAGALLMLAVAVKFTAIILLPFMLLGARPLRRRLRVLEGATLAAVPLVAGSVAFFGLSLPNLADQTSLLTQWSLPNIFGQLLGLGGATAGLLKLGSVAVVIAVALLIRRGRDWLSGAGWATLALLASLAWLMPWYIVWVLPLAALGTSLRLRRVTLAFSLFLLLTFLPATTITLTELGYVPLSSAVGQASIARQNKLEQ